MATTSSISGISTASSQMPSSNTLINTTTTTTTSSSSSNSSSLSLSSTARLKQGSRNKNKVSAREARNRFKKPKPLDLNLLLHEDCSRSENAEAIALSIVQLIVSKGADILFKHHIQRKAISTTAVETVSNAFRAINTHLLRHDVGEPALVSLQNADYKIDEDAIVENAVDSEIDKESKEETLSSTVDGSNSNINEEQISQNQDSEKENLISPLRSLRTQPNVASNSLPLSPATPSGQPQPSYDYESVFSKIPCFLPQPTASKQNWLCEEEPSLCEEDRWSREMLEVKKRVPGKHVVPAPTSSSHPVKTASTSHQLSASPSTPSTPLSSATAPWSTSKAVPNDQRKNSFTGNYVDLRSQPNASRKYHYSQSLATSSSSSSSSSPLLTTIQSSSSTATSLTDGAPTPIALSTQSLLSSVGSKSRSSDNDIGASDALVEVPVVVTQEMLDRERLREMELKRLKKKRTYETKRADEAQRLKDENEHFKSLRQQLKGREFTFDQRGSVILINAPRAERLSQFRHTPKVKVLQPAAPVSTQSGLSSKSSFFAQNALASSQQTSTRRVRRRSSNSSFASLPLVDTNIIQPPLVQTLAPAPGVVLRANGAVKAGSSFGQGLQSINQTPGDANAGHDPSGSINSRTLTRTQYLQMLEASSGMMGPISTTPMTTATIEMKKASVKEISADTNTLIKTAGKSSLSESNTTSTSDSHKRANTTKNHSESTTQASITAPQYRTQSSPQRPPSQTPRERHSLEHLRNMALQNLVGRGVVKSGKETFVSPRVRLPHQKQTIMEATLAFGHASSTDSNLVKPDSTSYLSSIDNITSSSNPKLPPFAKLKKDSVHPTKAAQYYSFTTSSDIGIGGNDEWLASTSSVPSLFT